MFMEFICKNRGIFPGDKVAGAWSWTLTCF